MEQNKRPIWRKKMIKEEIPFQKSGLYTSLIEDYLRQKDSVKPLVHHFFNENTVLDFIKQRQKHTVDRDILHDVIEIQYKSANIIPPESLTKLKKESTFTITTGHQLSLLGGPMFFTYKIIAAINLAKILKEQHPSYNFLPVFWMASEDHDFEEIQTINANNKSYAWQTPQQGAVGRFSIDDNFLEILKQLEKEISAKPFASELISLAKKCCQKGNTLAQATRCFVHNFFVDSDLIIIDGDDEQLKNQFLPIAQKEFQEKITFQNVSKTNNHLDEHGYHKQVYVREVNMFSLAQNNRQLVEDKLPEKAQEISPNALLRPVYQEKVLPNIAYIGGAGEMAYWLQLKSTFDAFDVNFPALVVRNSVLITSPKTQRNLAKLNLPSEAIFKHIHEVQKQIAVAKTDDTLSFEKEFKQIQQAYMAIKQRAKNIDPTLGASVEAKLKFNQNFLDDLEKRLIRYRKKQLDTDMQRLADIKEEVFPGGSFQERKLSFVEAYATYGKAMFKDLYKAINVLNPNIKICEF